VSGESLRHRRRGGDQKRRKSIFSCYGAPLTRIHDDVFYPLSSSVLIRVHPWLNSRALLSFTAKWFIRGQIHLCVSVCICG